MDRSTPSRAQVRERVIERMDQLYVRGAPEVGPAQALEQLHGQLVDAAGAYDAGPQQQRQAVCDAIEVVLEFLKGQGFSGATLVPLRRVVWAIDDVCRQNHPDPLFCEKRSSTKPRRSLADAVRQGHLAAIADAWLASASDEEGDEAAVLERAARYMSGVHFGKLDRAALNSARTYQRKSGQNELVYKSYEQMMDALAAEASAIDDGPGSRRAAILVQINALNAREEIRRS